MILSICIPTYNRINQLDNCLNSILISKKNVDDFNFEICISDNNSKENTEEIIQKYNKELKIKFNRNEKNFGFAINAIKTVSMAQGEFSWMIGDDDLILPKTLLKLKNLLQNNSDNDYFFINSYHLNSIYLGQFSSPFDTNNLNFENMKKISPLKISRSAPFWEVIDPKVSWDFLIGIYLSIFKTEKWLKSIDVIDQEKIKDTGVWSNFDNTCLHPIVIANAFKNSKAYICAEPLSVNLLGEREWKSMYEFVECIRIPELLDYYRTQGLNLKSYLYCKNYALRNFSNYMFKIIIGGEKMGRNYLNIKKHILKNLFYPNVYLSVIYFIFRRIFNR
jgi:glycosyltransferase involved in cell wall biosynthesis